MDKRGWGVIGWLSAALPWAAVLSAALLAGGCASTPGAGADLAHSDPPTESDDTEARRRARIRMELAVGYFEQGQTNVALDELKQVLAADPTFPDAYNLRGLIYMRMNDLRQAEENFRRAVSLNPRDGNTLHNLGWLQCQQRRYDDAQRSFEQALANPFYGERAKTLMIQGLCHSSAGKKAEAEASLARAYELDAGNPIIGYNLANLLYGRGEFTRAQFLTRRLNNSQLANAETLWLGVKVERSLGDRLAMNQLADQLRRRFPQSREAKAYERGAFDE
jgi:type IV pilus assembly protein PilF